MAGHGGGAWKVAYADFVTAMMAFFMVMWIVAQSKPVKQAIAQYFNDPWKTATKPSGNSSGGYPMLPGKKPNRLPGGERRHGAPPVRRGDSDGTGARATVQMDRDAATEDHAGMLAVHKGTSPCVGTLIVFPESSDQLSDAAKETLERLAPELRGLPNKIEIRGHATRRPVKPGGPPQDAWSLSYARCIATMKFLEQQGVDQNRMRLSQGGSFEPYSLSVVPAKLAYNSRVEVYMLNEIAEDTMGTPE